jgi:hypothetical protein
VIAAHPAGATLAVRGQPRAKAAGVVGVRGDALKVAVTAPADGGRANDALRDVLRDWLGVKRSRVDLLTGHAHRDKVFLIRGVTAEELSALVAARLG